MQGYHLRASNAAFLDDSNKKMLSVAVMGGNLVGKSSIISHLVTNYHQKADQNDQDKENKDHSINVCGLVLDFFEDQDDVLADIKRVLSANVFILVFAVDKAESFEYVEKLKDMIREMKGDRTPMVVVGNKHDLSQRQVGFAYTDCVVSMDWELPYLEVSNKTGYNMGLILPYLFRHDSLGCYQHLFLAPRSQSPRRRSTGSLRVPKLEKSEPQRQRTFSVSIGSTFRRGSKRERIGATGTPSEQPQRRKTSTARKLSLINIFTCNDDNEDQQEAAAEADRQQQQAQGSRLGVPDDMNRKRSHSLSVIREDTCELSELAPVQCRTQQRRCSVSVHSELTASGNHLELLKASDKHGSWLSSVIRKHLKK